MVDIGSRDINGTVRHLFPNADYVGVDPVDGPAVDVVGDGTTWRPDEPVDVVVCCEVFEHTDAWPAICENAAAMLKSGGLFVVTCAGPGRGPHSAVDGRGIRDGEHYANVSIGELADVLEACGFVGIVTDQAGTDTRAAARKG